jgi:hypothetical protein
MKINISSVRKISGTKDVQKVSNKNKYGDVITYYVVKITGSSKPFVMSRFERIGCDTTIISNGFIVIP